MNYDAGDIALLEALNNLETMGLIKYKLHGDGINFGDMQVSIELTSDAFPLDYQSTAVN